MHFDEVADGLAAPSTGVAVGADGRGDDEHTVAGEELGHPADAANVGVAVFARKPKTFGEMGANHVAVENFDTAVE